MFRCLLRLGGMTLLTCGCTQTLDFDAVSRDEVATDSGELISSELWLATASHTLDMSSPSFAIDRVASTNWITGVPQTPGMWLAIDFGETLAFRSIQVDAKSDRQDSCEKLDVYVSEDGESWDRVRADVPGDPELRIELGQQVSARSLKLTLPADVTKDRWWRIDELRLLK
jgi:hypothetical protein